VNLKQLSDMLALSQTTVSRALNGYPEVSEETRRRVADAAKRHGYRPNPSARRLATGKAGMIGYVMPTGAAVDIDPHFVEFLSGLGDYARGHELDLVLSPAAADEEEMTYRRVVANKQVDAVYVSSPRPADRRITLLNQLGIPYIVHGRSEGLDFDYAFLDIDNEAAFHDGARLLVQLGHTRIGLINGDLGETFAVFRERGASRALAASGLTLMPERIRSLAMTEENGFRAAMSLLQAEAPPTAILCSSLIMALGVVRAIRDLGLSVPGDVSLIAHDDVFPWLKPENFSVPLTTTRSSIRAAGQRLAERLAAKISGLESEPRGEVWPVDLVVRGSIAGAKN
jgi:LacI family transcriptional regulator